VSEFCQQCSIDIFGEDFGELANLCKEGETARVLCEDCGIIVVDHTGKRIYFTADQTSPIVGRIPEPPKPPPNISIRDNEKMK
jgi:hypothetical protein